jgi:hypothetical protein
MSEKADRGSYLREVLDRVEKVLDRMDAATTEEYVKQARADVKAIAVELADPQKRPPKSRLGFRASLFKKQPHDDGAAGLTG